MTKDKICPKCKIEKSVDNFHKNKYNKDNCSSRCKNCRRIVNLETQKKKEMFKCGLKLCSYCKEYKLLSDFYKSNNRYTSHCKKCKLMKYRDNYKEISIKRKQTRQQHIEEYRRKGKVYYRNNILKRRESYKKWRIQNQEKLSYKQKTRRKNDIKFRLRGNLSNRMFQAIKGNTKSISTMIILGCEVEYLMFHLQKQFKDNMSWDNYGKNGWEIDHIKTLC
ncbi:MAG: hypothetical protein ACTSWD_04635 [Candidatus Heimdallarchaeota archaeon]